MVLSKRLIYKGLVALPAVFLFGIGAKSRIDTDPFVFTCPTPLQDKQILAYRPYVMDTQSLSGLPTLAARARQARKVANEWISGRKLKTLCPLVPISYDDSSRDGVKSEILTQNCTLSNFLNYLAQKEQDEGRHAQAIQDALLAAQVAAVFKYSDDNSLVLDRVVQLRSLRLIVRSAEKSRDIVNHQVLDELESCRPDAEQFSRMQDLQKILLREYMRRMNIDPASIVAGQNVAAGGVLIPMMTQGHSLLASTQNEPIPIGAPAVERAKFGERQTGELIDKIEALAPRTTSEPGR